MSTALHAPPLVPVTPREWPAVPPVAYPFLLPASEGLGRLDDYLVLRVLGTGGMGVVFLARDLTLDREVALKVLDPRTAGDETSRRYFLREARAMAALEHENVVPLYRVGEANGVLFLAMPVLRGKTLETWLAESSRRPLADVLRIAREIAEGLAAAHAKGLVHRDIKPANVWLEAKAEEGGSGSALPFTFERVKILDFGLARPVATDQQITAKEFVVGTPGYLAPELIQGAQPTPACDLFGLGVLLYQCFAGEVPFHRESPLATMLATISAEPMELVARVPDLPAPVAELVMQLLAKDPNQRPASAAAVAARLHELERDPHCAAAVVLAPIPARAPAPARRRVRLWQATAALLASAAVAFGVYVYANSRERPAAGAELTPPAPAVPPAAPAKPKPLEPLGTYTGLTGPAMAAAYLPDGRTFLVLGEDGWVHEWHNGMPGPARKKWRAHPGRGYGLAVCPNGRVVTGGNNAADESEVVGWSADGSRKEWTIRAGLTWTNVISLDRDGTRGVATGRGGTAVVFDPRDGTELTAFQTDEWLSGVAISPDGTRAASGSQWETFGRVWDMSNAELLHKSAKLPAGASKAVVFSPDGKLVAFGGFDGLVRLVKTDTGEVSQTLYGHTTAPLSLAFSPNGARIASGGHDSTVRVWDVKTGDELAAFRGHAEPVWTVAFASHGRQILSAGRDRRVFTWANPK